MDAYVAGSNPLFVKNTPAPRIHDRKTSVFLIHRLAGQG